jgi:hypothetical protein
MMSIEWYQGRIEELEVRECDLQQELDFVQEELSALRSDLELAEQDELESGEEDVNA